MNASIPAFFQKVRLSRGMMFGILIISALFAFEIFNFGTTEFALSDLLGDLSFASIRWATVLAIAFCGIDFAGIARLFTPEQGSDEPTEVWYLFGAWLLAAAMNAMLTWWGVSIAILNHDTLGNAVIPRETLLKFVPIFVAVMVWLIRVLIIGSFSVAGDRLFSQADVRLPSRRSQTLTANRGLQNQPALSGSRSNRQVSIPSFRPAPKARNNSEGEYNRDEMPASRPEPSYARPEPTYHPVSMSARTRTGNTTPRS